MAKITDKLISETVRKTFKNFLKEEFDDFDELSKNDNEWTHQDDEFSEAELDAADDIGQIGIDDSGIEDDESEILRNFEKNQFQGDKDDYDLDEHPDEWPVSGEY